MLDVKFEDDFLKAVEKIRDNKFKEKIKKQTAKIINDPEIGKPIMYNRKGTREVYISPFRLSYSYSKEENKITLLCIYHKDEQ